MYWAGIEVTDQPLTLGVLSRDPWPPWVEHPLLPPPLAGWAPPAAAWLRDRRLGSCPVIRLGCRDY